MIDLGNDVAAYVDYEENHPVELARGFSDVAVLHKDYLIFQTCENIPRHGIVRVWIANVRLKNRRISCLSVDENHCKCHAVGHSQLSISRRPTHRVDEPDAAYICLYSSSSRV